MRDFVQNAALVVVINLLVKGSYLLGIERAVQNSLDPGSYGLYFMLFNFAFLLQIIGDFGLSTFNTRYVAQARHLVGRYFPDLVSLKLVLATLYLLLVPLAGWLSGFRGAEQALLLLIGINFMLQSTQLFLRSNLTGLGYYRTDSWLSVLDKVLMIGLVGGLLWGGRLVLWQFVVAQTLAWLLTLGSTYYLLRPHLGQWSWRWRPHRVGVLLRRGLPFSITILLMTAYTRTDALMLEWLLPDGRLELDVYAAGYRLLDAANMIGFLLASLLIPMFSRQLAVGESPIALARLGLTAIWSGGISGVVATVVWATPLMVQLYDLGDAYSGRVMAILLTTFLTVGGGYIYGALLTAAGQIGRLNWIFLAGLVLNVILNLWLIPLREAEGAAIATAFTQLAVLLGQGWLARRYCDLRLPPTVVLRLLLLALLAGVVAYGLRSLSTLDWRFSFLISVMSSLAIAFALRLLDWRQWISLLHARTHRD